MHGMRDRDDRRRRLRYGIDGEPGGSGNPVFDEQLQVVALHVVRTDSWLGSITRRNLLGEGLPVDLIVRDLASRGIVLTPPDAAGVSFSA
jgi:hypothetical protein